MKKEYKYAVIGGQYNNICYGTTPTLLGAKRLARQHQEYWDNYIGWTTPMIFDINDTKYDKGRRYPVGDPSPITYFHNGKWYED